jgi:hypothetical protein
LDVFNPVQTEEIMNRVHHTTAHLPIALAFGVAVALAPAISLAGPPSTTMDFLPCVDEGGTCTIGDSPDGKLVAYGDATNSRWVFSIKSGSFSCSNATFGDPDVGASKTCLFAPYGFIAFEGETLNLQATPSRGISFAYGANGSFVYSTLPGGSTYGCNNGTFGSDPAPGVTKACYLPLPEYVFTASEGETFSLGTASSMPVAYGANGSFFSGVFTGSVTCANVPFGGDPSPGNTKRCYVLGNGFNTVYGPIASEVHSFNGFESTFYGNPLVPNFVLLDSASGTCSNSFFGGDPAIGFLKSCWAAGNIQ